MNSSNTGAMTRTLNPQTSFISQTTTDDDLSVSSHRRKNDTLQNLNRRGRFFAFTILMLGTIAGAGFLYVGISSHKSDEIDQFFLRSIEVLHEFQNAWSDYEEKALWIHQACRTGNMTRRQFSELYYNLIASGLQFQAAEFIPNVTRDKRDLMERESQLYYSENYPHINYTGFKGLEPVTGTDEYVIQERSEQPFYFPVHYVEPIIGNEAAIDYDLYSSRERRETIDLALTTWKPALSGRVRLIQETDEDTYSVLLFHPGVPIPVIENLQPRDVALIVIRIPELLAHGLANQIESASVHLYDSTESIPENPPAFLGGARVNNTDNNHRESTNNTIEFLNEVELKDLRENKNILRFEEKIHFASRTWTIVITPLGHYHTQNYSFVICGGVMIEIACICLAFWAYSHHRYRMNTIKEIQREAEAEKAIVKSLYPSGFRSRLISDISEQDGHQKKWASPIKHSDACSKDGSNCNCTPLPSELLFGSKPNADLFSATTIMFADLVGFTAWSSDKEPEEVFALLEVLYDSFDNIAKRHRVFKVETVGDCYVAVTGLPRPNKHHGEYMARFASACQKDMREMLPALQTTLGPDVVKLDIRIGLHSGPVTAGVLRGEKGRFQLFGDTMNTASRIESTCLPGKIQVSRETADELVVAGRGHWVTPREETVEAKGKGRLRTFWLTIPDTEELNELAGSCPRTRTSSESSGTIDC